MIRKMRQRYFNPALVYFSQAGVQVLQSVPVVGSRFQIDDRNDTCEGQRLRALPMGFNAVTLMLNFVVGSALGYPFWLLAARLFDANEVGLGAGALAAMRLCSQLATLGLGATLIMLVPRAMQATSSLINSAVAWSATISVIASISFLLLSTAIFSNLRVLADSPVYSLVFILMVIVTSQALILDSTFSGLRRTDQILMRSIAQGTVALVAVVVSGFIFGTRGLAAILIAWAGAMLASSLLGHLQLRKALADYRFRPAFSREMTRTMLKVSLPNSALTLTLLAPIAMIPILVSEVLSPAATAYWYATWSLNSLVMMIPNTTSKALFAEASSRPSFARKATARSIKLSLALGIPLALFIALVANVGLGFMGPGYAEAGTVPLQLLVIAVIPRTFISAFITNQRAIGELTEPTVYGVATAILSIVGTVAGGMAYGLIGVALAWLATQWLGSIWAIWRLWRGNDSSMTKDMTPSGVQKMETFSND